MIALDLHALCKTARNEHEVRQLLDNIWEKTGESEEILARASDTNADIFEFEKMLEESKQDNP